MGFVEEPLSWGCKVTSKMVTYGPKMLFWRNSLLGVWTGNQFEKCCTEATARYEKQFIPQLAVEDKGIKALCPTVTKLCSRGCFKGRGGAGICTCTWVYVLPNRVTHGSDAYYGTEYCPLGG